MENEKKYPSLILGLDISTACIGISVIYDDGVNLPNIEIISHVTPKIDKNIKGIEALCLRCQIFEENFLNRMDEVLAGIKCPLKKITECVIEAPMVYATGGSNAATVATLLEFNGMLSHSVYKTLGIVPIHISSYDARMRSFPELLAVRKFNKRGEIYPLKHIENAIKEQNLILFGSYPFDCDKKCVMMNIVSEKYPGIPWIYNKKGELKKENYDSCDSLVCALAYSNEKRYGPISPEIVKYNIEEFEAINPETGELTKSYTISYTMRVWEKE